MPRPIPLPRSLPTTFTTGDARDRGVPPHRLRAGDLTSPFRGIRSRSAPMTVEDWCEALAPHLSEHQVFSHTTAAALWGLPLPRSEPLPLHVSAFRGREPRMRGVVGHRIARERVERWVVDGLPVVSAADAWCELGPMLSHRDLVAAGDRLLGWPDPLVDEGAVDAAMRRHRRSRGIRALREARAAMRPGSASRRETFLRMEVLAAGLPEPECNGEIRLSTGADVVGDLVFRRWRVILEYDGDHHRFDGRQFARDIERLNALAADGWIVVRVRTGISSAAAIVDLERALRRRGWRPE